MLNVGISLKGAIIHYFCMSKNEQGILFATGKNLDV